jgi:hypothetical protein
MQISVSGVVRTECSLFFLGSDEPEFQDLTTRRTNCEKYNVTHPMNFPPRPSYSASNRTKFSGCHTQSLDIAFHYFKHPLCKRHRSDSSSVDIRTECYLVGCKVLYTLKYLPKFRWNLMPQSSELEISFLIIKEFNRSNNL